MFGCVTILTKSIKLMDYVQPVMIERLGRKEKMSKHSIVCILTSLIFQKVCAVLVMKIRVEKPQNVSIKINLKKRVDYVKSVIKLREETIKVTSNKL